MSAEPPAVNVEGLVKRRAWQHPISLTIEAGEYVAVVGKNGSGKSTLLETVIGVLKPDAGRVELLGKNPHRFPYIRRRVAVAFQDISLDSNYPVGRTLALHARIFGITRARLRAMAQKFEVPLEATPFHMSGGQRKRAELTKALAQSAEVYFLDEPTAGLDREGIQVLSEEIEALRRRNATIVVITHDLGLLPQVDRVIDFDELKERSARMAGERHRLVLELSTWKPELGPELEKIKSVISYKVEPNPEVLKKLGIPPELFKGVIFVDDVSKVGIKGEARKSQISLDALFERCRLELETTDNKSALPEVLKLLITNGIEVLEVLQDE